MSLIQKYASRHRSWYSHYRRNHTTSVLRYFLSQGYADEEVYATTYADGRNYNGPLNCEYVKAVIIYVRIEATLCLRFGP